MAAVVLGVAVLIGWAFDVQVFKTVVPGQASMKANTALCFVSCGCSLWLWHRDDADGWIAGALPAAGVVAVAAVTLVEYAGGLDLGIDQLLFSESGTSGGHAPGRMAVNTAVAFLCLGSALALLWARPRAARDLAALLGWAAGTVGLLAIMGYATGLHELSGIGPYVTVAGHTGCGLLVLGLGVAFAQPSARSVRRLTALTAAGRLLRWMVPAAIGVLLVFAVVQGVLIRSETADLDVASWVAASGAMVLLIVVAVRASRSLDELESKREQARLEVVRANRGLAEEQFRHAFDHALIGMMIMDPDGRYTRVNDAFCALVGHPRTTLIGLSYEQITHPDDLAAAVGSLPALLSGELAAYTCEKRYIHAAGHPVWASLGVTLIHDADGHPVHFIAQAQDITERRRYESQLRHMAEHDPLTGLLNRGSFERELESHVARVTRFGVRGAVLMIDLDNFKYYNDTQGHNAGDKLIVRIAQALRARLRETDVIARLGGDEFAVLLPQEDCDGADVVAQAVLEDVREQAPATALGDRRRVTASIGVTWLEDGERITAEEMMVNADLAMYDAKEHGRDRIAHYCTEQHSHPSIGSVRWATEIDEALAQNRFELLAQPIQPLRPNGPTQYELLLRMRDSHGDLIPPGTFLYIAERLGLINEIDRWVTGRAIDMLADNRAVGRDLRFAVNLSGHSIGDTELIELIERRLDETGVPPDRLIFEITETTAIANIARGTAFAQHLSELGCKFALDDFGAGFGSFYYLKRLPFDYLKIDREFVRHCADNETGTDRTLISAVVQIARGMGKRTIAEFVENQDTVEVLTHLGVDYGQGYHLGRPAPLSEHLNAAGTVTAGR